MAGTLYNPGLSKKCRIYDGFSKMKISVNCRFRWICGSKLVESTLSSLLICIFLQFIRRRNTMLYYCFSLNPVFCCVEYSIADPQQEGLPHNILESCLQWSSYLGRIKIQQLGLKIGKHFHFPKTDFVDLCRYIHIDRSWRLSFLCTLAWK